MGRNYANEFVEHDIVAIGGGQHERAVQRFWEIQPGDVVVLRNGGSLTSIRSIGVAADEAPDEAGPYFTAQGWPLEYMYRVRWLLEEPQLLPTLSLPRERVTRVRSAANRSKVVSALEKSALALKLDRDLRSLPPPVVPVSADELSLPEPLQSLRLLADRFQKLRYRDAKAFGPLPRENEATSHFVVPLLVALGWPYHLIAVEWRRIDVAVFARLPRHPRNCHLIIEVKSVGTGWTRAKAQSAGYKRDRGLPPETQSYGSDGLHFWAFRDDGGTLELSLTHPTVEGLDVLERLRPPREIMQ